MAWAVVLLSSAHVGLASAQSETPTAMIEIAGDERRRGISWNGGSPVLRASATASVPSDITVIATATLLRDSNRHGNADGVTDVSVRWSRQIGSCRVTADGRYHIFLDAPGLDYGEIGAQAATIIGPASLDIGAFYAPRQHRIGGDNLYMFVAGAVGIPGTPLTISGHAGHSAGRVDDARRATRLRPADSYGDYGVALDWYRGNWFMGLRYTGTTIGQTDHSDTGNRIIAHAGLSF